MIKNTFIYNPVRPDFIHKALDTLYQYTDMRDSRVIVVDQTLDGLKLDEKVHLVLRPHRNLGFSKSMNEGIIHGLRWESEYITCANDDVEYINSAWWDGVIETFTQYGENVLAVNPESLRIPLWGYGRPHGEYYDILPYKEKFSELDYNYLLKGDLSDQDLSHLPKTFPTQKSGVTDAIATWHTTFKSNFFEKIGLFEERYYPGAGEDYDLNARAYRENYRMLGTTKSWLWHWWGQSKDVTSGGGLPVIKELRWLNPHELWNPDKNNGQNMDPWGKWTDEKGEKHPMVRDKVIGIIDI